MPIQQSAPVPAPSPLSPTTPGSEVVAESRLVDQEPATSMNIQAPYDASIPHEVATSQAEAQAEMPQTAAMMGSGQGYGSDGYTIVMPDLDNDSPWNTDMSFPHQGP